MTQETDDVSWAIGEFFSPCFIFILRLIMIGLGCITTPSRSQTGNEEALMTMMSKAPTTAWTTTMATRMMKRNREGGDDENWPKRH
jgi:hypothetical protein